MVNPACAGMIPGQGQAVSATACKPRVCGDDPGSYLILSVRYR